MECGGWEGAGVRWGGRWGEEEEQGEVGRRQGDLDVARVCRCACIAATVEVLTW